MKVKELIFLLETIPNSDDIEVTFADLKEVKSVIPCQIGNKVYACITDEEQEPDNVLDIDEQMHEQQERDAEYAEIYAEMYESII